MLALVAAGLIAQTPAAPADCAKAATTPEINACAAQDLAAETERMETYLAAARRKALADDQGASDNGPASSQRAYLDNGQTAWVAYRDIVCNGVYNRWSGGTIRTLMALNCSTRMTRERTQVIWRDFLTYADATPPILPEPVGPASPAK
ncbi:lysozyme inhibitor LprI family protein [uncultured Brevundimonas sp.]|uniref:lysozyme inhibitor LprI family protein n=1 Tax=uncultured Brevundimonas sp. TaxID=213418 RepID=UPI00261AFCA7|nr:lysozyme inhibitor LprI family protein [uncultured Brevundimonas sp.]